MFAVSFDAKELLWHVKIAEDGERLATVKTNDAISTERFQTETLRRTEGSSESSPVLHEKNILNLVP